MKKQETVEKRFLKVLEQWEESKERKRKNIQFSMKKIVEKKRKLELQYIELERQLEKIESLPAPQAPSFEERNQQKKRSMEEEENQSSSSIPQQQDIEKSNFF